MTEVASRRIRAVLLASVLIALGSGCGGEQKRHPRTPGSGNPFAYDSVRPLDVHKLGTLRDGGLSVEKISYAAADGERVPALFARPRSVPGPYPCVIYQAGLNGPKESAAALWRNFANLGIATFSIDARYHGERARGRLNGLTAGLKPGSLERMLRLSVIDLRRGIDYLQSRDACDPEQIGFVGASFGGFLGALLAGVDKRVKAPVLIVAGGDWRKFLIGSDVLLPGVERNRPRFERVLRQLAPLDPARWIGRISPRPVFLINASRDRVVVRSASRALAAAARRPKRVYVVNGGHGAVVTGTAAGQVWARLGDWLSSKLVESQP